MLEVVAALTLLFLGSGPDPWLAGARADSGDSDACLDVWASRTAPGPSPELALSPAEQARLQAAGDGLFVVASLTQDELRVSIRDPLGVVGRVRAETDEPQPRGLLRRSGPSGRYAFTRPPDATGFRVSVFSRGCMPDRPLHTLTLAPRDLPSAPDPAKAADRLISAPPPAPEASAVTDGPAFPWWWFVGAAVVGAGVAAAAWDEF
ncbi:MAG: hypothetical protein AAFU79_00270 [Myxococcota bacterium]